MVLMYCLSLTARDNLRAPDARSLGMGGNATAHSPLFNPALLALQERPEVRADYYNRYSIPELATVSGGFTFPNPILPAGLHIASFGYDEYRESLFRLSAGKQLSEVWALGVSVQYALLQSEIFETDAARLSTDVGLAFHPSENWLFTLAAINFPSVLLNGEHVDTKRLATFFMQAGINWQMTDNLLLTGGAAHTGEMPFGASLGMEFVPLPDFRIRAGVRTSPFCPSLGIGYGMAGIRLDVAAIFHPVLGASTGIGLVYSF
jgi:hypothetical protein